MNPGKKRKKKFVLPNCVMLIAFFDFFNSKRIIYNKFLHLVIKTRVVLNHASIYAIFSISKNKIPINWNRCDSAEIIEGTGNTKNK